MQSYHLGFRSCVFREWTNARSESRGLAARAVRVILHYL